MDLIRAPTNDRFAMTNEERFIASCEVAGEADVRQKLATNRFSEQKALWAGDWLEQVESAKSDATKDEERTISLRVLAVADQRITYGRSTLLVVLLLAGGALYLLIG